MPNHWDDRQRLRRRAREEANRYDRDFEADTRFDYDTSGRIGQEGGYLGGLSGYSSFPYGQHGYYTEPTYRGPGYSEHGPEYGERGRVRGERPSGREDLYEEHLGVRDRSEKRYTESWEVPGPFTGRGPRGYQRSDERVREEVCEALSAHGYLDASDIEVEVHDAEATLRGTVHNRQAKRMAENVAESIRSVRDVHNRLRIRSEEPERERAVTEGENPMGGVNLEL